MKKIKAPEVVVVDVPKTDMVSMIEKCDYWLNEIPLMKAYFSDWVDEEIMDTFKDIKTILSFNWKYRSRVIN